MGAAPSHEDPGRPRARPRPPSLGARPANAAPAPAPSLFQAAGARAPRDVRPIEFRPPVQQSGIVLNLVSIDKASLRLVPGAAGPGGGVYLVQFEFDAGVPGYITVHYGAREVVKRVRGGEGGGAAAVERVSYVGKAETLPAKTKFGVGKKQKYCQKEERGLDMRRVGGEELKYKHGSDVYPIVIRLEAVYPPESTVPEGARVRSQTTFASVEEVEGGGYRLNIVAQQVLTGGTIYRIRDLYGIGAADVTATKQADAAEEDDMYKMDSTHECVICLTESCNTAVLPCNHLCLCDDCARILCAENDYQRRKCPVCRTQLGSLLRIISPANHATTDDTSSAVAGSTIPEGSTAGATIARTDSVPSSKNTAAGIDDERLTSPAHEESSAADDQGVGTEGNTNDDDIVALPLGRPAPSSVS